MTPWPDRLFEPGPKRILAIDGGGVRGAVAIGLLKRLEAVLRQRHGRPDMVLSDYFDLIGGVSVGALIAAGLALGRETEAIEARFRGLGSRLFHGGLPRIPLVQTRFDPARLKRLIAEEFGEVTLGDAPWKTGFAAIAKRVDTGSSWLLSNSPHAKYWDGARAGGAPSANIPNRDYRLGAVVNASAAAPFYFDLVTIEIAQGVSGVFFDGAMTAHGNPSLQLAITALVPAYGLGWKAGADNLLIVSVGAGAPRPRKPAWAHRSSPAILKALHALVSMAYDTSELAITTLQWLGRAPQPWRINSEIGGVESGPPEGFAPMWTVLRYDAPLERDWLEANLGAPITSKMEARLQRMDDQRLIPMLLNIGSLAGERQILPEHFPESFAPARDRGAAAAQN